MTTNHPLYFQFKFARLRCDMLNAYSQLLTSCSLVKLCPPAKMIEVVNDAQCYSRITNQVELNSVDNLTLIEVSRKIVIFHWLNPFTGRYRILVCHSFLPCKQKYDSWVLLIDMESSQSMFVIVCVPN